MKKLVLLGVLMVVASLGFAQSPQPHKKTVYHEDDQQTATRSVTAPVAQGKY